jgi:hypothetical protein
MASDLRQGPFVLHLLVGLLVIGGIVVLNALESGENWAPIFLPAVVVVWALVAVAVRLLADAPRPLWFFSWLLPFVWPALAWAITLGAITLIG